MLGNIILYHIAVNFCLEKMLIILPAALMDANFYPSNFLSHVNDYIAYTCMVIFIVWVKFIPYKYFCNVRVGLLGEFLSSKIFPAMYTLYSVYYYCISSQCDNKASEDSTPVHVLALEDGAGIEISSQHPVPDSAVQTAPGVFASTIIP